IEVKYWQEWNKEASQEDRVVVCLNIVDFSVADPCNRDQPPAAHLSGSSSRVQRSRLTIQSCF
ncbi:MAG: hypothetical protein WBH36_14540, partial [Syntrophobacteria bacterium]